MSLVSTNLTRVEHIPSLYRETVACHMASRGEGVITRHEKPNDPRRKLRVFLKVGISITRKVQDHIRQ